MEREASPWGLEPRDVQSPDEVGPEGSLEGEGGSAPPRSVPGRGEGAVVRGRGREWGGLDTWDLGRWGRGPGVLGLLWGRWEFQHLHEGQRPCLRSGERLVQLINGGTQRPSRLHTIWVFCNSLILQATCVRMRKRKFLSKKALGTMRWKRYLLGWNPRALGLSHKAQSLNPRAPGLSLKAQVLSPEALGLCPRAPNLHPEPLIQILRAPSLNHKAWGMSPGALAMNPGALGMNLKARGMSLRALGTNPRTLSSKPKALNLKLQVPNSRKVQRCFSVPRKRVP